MGQPAIYRHLRSTPLPSISVASLAPMSFLENLHIGLDGAITITSLLDGRIWQLAGGHPPRLLAQIDGRPSSIEALPDRPGWIIFGWTTKGAVAAWELEQDGQWQEISQFPEAVFPNGAQPMGGGHYLLADSVTATIWDFYYPTGRIGRWLSHELLGPRDGTWEPALNGIKLWRNRLYMTNSSTGQIMAVAVDGHEPAGEITVICTGIHADDFAFDIEGSMYLTTHPLDTVLKLTQAGELIRVAGSAEGVRGCTACRFGRTEGDETGLYVTTDGGLFNPASGGLQPAQIIRLEAGIRGAE